MWLLHTEKQRSMCTTQATLHKSFKSVFCFRVNFCLTMNIGSYITLIGMLESFSHNFLLEWYFEEMDGTWMDGMLFLFVFFFCLSYFFFPNLSTDKK